MTWLTLYRILFHRKDAKSAKKKLGTERKGRTLLRFSKKRQLISVFSVPFISLRPLRLCGEKVFST